MQKLIQELQATDVTDASLTNRDYGAIGLTAGVDLHAHANGVLASQLGLSVSGLIQALKKGAHVHLASRLLEITPVKGSTLVTYPSNATVGAVEAPIDPRTLGPLVPPVEDQFSVNEVRDSFEKATTPPDQNKDDAFTVNEAFIESKKEADKVKAQQQAKAKSR